MQDLHAGAERRIAADFQFDKFIARWVPVDEIVFFGRLETRKGLELFCQAITLLLGEGGTRPCRIAFLGKIGEVAGASALAHIAEASATWGIPWMIRNDLDTEGAKGFLAKPGRLAVIASVIENSPYTVLECLAAGQAFLAADVGGVRELIDVRDQAHVVFERTPEPDGQIRLQLAELDFAVV